MQYIGLFILVFACFFLLFNVVPKYPYLWVFAGTRKIARGEYEEGLRLFKKGAMHKRGAPFTKVRYAFLEIKYGSLDRAMSAINQITGDIKTPDNIKYEAKAIYALTLYQTGQAQEAKETMLEVYNNYKTTNMYCTLGYLFNILEDSQKAVQFNLEAMDYNSEHPVILDNLGQSYYLNGQYDDALKVYEKLIPRAPGFPEAYYNYSLVLIECAKYEEALEELEKALSKDFNRLTTISREEIENKIKELEEKCLN